MSSVITKRSIDKTKPNNATNTKANTKDLIFGVIGHSNSGKSALINLMFKVIGSTHRPAVESTKFSTKNMFVYDFANLGEHHWNMKVIKFNSETEDDKKKVRRIIQGLPQGTSIDDDYWKNAPTDSSNKINQVVVASTHTLLEPPSTWIDWLFCTNHTNRERILEVVDLWKFLDIELEYTPYLILTHSDCVPEPKEDDYLCCELIKHGVAQNRLIRVGKECPNPKICKDHLCEHPFTKGSCDKVKSMLGTLIYHEI